MSGLVRGRYWRAPTILRYSVASERGAPSYAESFEPDARGVGHGLESCIWVRVSRSKVYLVWVKTRAVDVRLASIPKQEEMKITKIFHGEVRTQSLNERKGSRYSFWLPRESTNPIPKLSEEVDFRGKQSPFLCWINRSVNATLDWGRLPTLFWVTTHLLAVPHYLLKDEELEGGSGTS